jgi:hypothetical protein
MSMLKFHQAHRLSVYAPQEEAPETEDGPVILHFHAGRRRAGDANDGMIDRIRTIRQNRFCPCCGKAHVQPVSANAALYSRDAMPVPGTGTLVGFHCLQCGHDWRA